MIDKLESRVAWLEHLIDIYARQYVIKPIALLSHDRRQDYLSVWKHSKN